MFRSIRRFSSSYSAITISIAANVAGSAESGSSVMLRLVNDRWKK